VQSRLEERRGNLLFQVPGRGLVILFCFRGKEMCWHLTAIVTVLPFLVNAKILEKATMGKLLLITCIWNPNEITLENMSYLHNFFILESLNQTGNKKPFDKDELRVMQRPTFKTVLKGPPSCLYCLGFQNRWLPAPSTLLSNTGPTLI
jgi:hypothetical protein